jgi:predicted nucleic acid-binding Zn finger protein
VDFDNNLVVLGWMDCWHYGREEVALTEEEIQKVSTLLQQLLDRIDILGKTEYFPTN